MYLCTYNVHKILWKLQRSTLGRSGEVGGPRALPVELRLLARLFGPGNAPPHNDEVGPLVGHRLGR